MSRPTRLSAMSSSTSSAPDSDGPTVSATEQTLTPATSLSETSSNSGTATNGGKEQLQQRQSRRVTRSSMNSQLQDDGETASTGAQLEEEKRMSDTANGINSEATIKEKRTTRLSNSLHDVTTTKHENTSEESSTRRTTRSSLTTESTKRIAANFSSETTSTTEGTGKDELQQDKGDVTKGKNDDQKNKRRSTRLSLLQKTTEAVNRTSTILGKRSREVMEKGKSKLKEPDRRSSLRPRNVIKQPTAPPEPQPTTEIREVKRKRASKGDSQSPGNEAEDPKPRKPVPYRRKKWLSHGLYAGQDRYFDPRLNDAKNRVKFGKKNEEDRKKFLPLPMFAGERLLQNGRDFKLPFDIFSPLPPGQPKPNEWRKVNKSKTFLFLFSYIYKFYA